MTPVERAQVAALVEAACELAESTANMLRGMRMDQTIPVHAKAAMGSRVLKLEKWASDAEAALDALLSEPAKGGPCETCWHREMTSSRIPVAYCDLLSGESAVYCDETEGGCWAWEPKEANRG